MSEEQNIQEIPKTDERFTGADSPAPRKPEIVLSEEQQQAVSMVVDFVKGDGPAEFGLGGYAGTGKTTVIKAIIKAVQKEDVYPVCASFTGKAVNVLQRKQIQAQTLHSLMYDVSEYKGKITFTRKDRLESNPDLIIVDEASMVSTELYDTIRHFRKKLLFVGDPGQLEPVGDNPNLMKRADFILQQIHRQAGQSPIIQLASIIREGRPMPAVGATAYGGEGENYSDFKIQLKDLNEEVVENYDQLLCAKNLTRTKINGHIRAYKKLQPRAIVNGEKIIVLRNNQSFGVFNGMILFVREIESEAGDHWIVDCEDETGRKFRSLPIWKLPYEEPQEVGKGQDVIIPRLPDRTQLVYSDYAYCITCHKSQGSEWDKVAVFDEWMPPRVWDMKRWRYTAVTRAAKRLLYML